MESQKEKGPRKLFHRPRSHLVSSQKKNPPLKRCFSFPSVFASALTQKLLMSSIGGCEGYGPSRACETGPHMWHLLSGFVPANILLYFSKNVKVSVVNQQTCHTYRFSKD